MLPDEPTVNVATAAAVLNIPPSHVVAEVRAHTLAGHDDGRHVHVERQALARRLNALGLPHPTAALPEPQDRMDNSPGDPAGP